MKCVLQKNFRRFQGGTDRDSSKEHTLSRLGCVMQKCPDGRSTWSKKKFFWGLTKIGASRRVPSGLPGEIVFLYNHKTRFISVFF